MNTDTQRMDFMREMRATLAPDPTSHRWIVHFVQFSTLHQFCGDTAREAVDRAIKSRAKAA